MANNIQDINRMISLLSHGVGEVSDGYHTFNELYEHRITLYIALCRVLDHLEIPVWKSRVHSDGTEWKGWFLMGINKGNGKQITYHLPENKWDICSFVETLEKAPEFDGHTSNDVLERISNIDRIL